MVRLVLVLGDQLTASLSALQKTDQANDVVVMAEVADEASYVPHHPKKIAFTFAAMRKFAAKLQNDGCHSTGSLSLINVHAPTRTGQTWNSVQTFTPHKWLAAIRAASRHDINLAVQKL